MAEFKSLADLKRCPFCGGEAKVFTYRNERDRTNPTVVKCKECGAAALIFSGDAMAKCYEGLMASAAGEKLFPSAQVARW